MSPFARRPPAEAPDTMMEAAELEDVDDGDLETHRPPAPTIPFVPTPLVEWSPAPVPTAAQRQPPSSNNMPTAPKRTSSDRSMELALRDQIWSGLQSGPTQTAQTGPHLPVQPQRGFAPAPPISSGSLVSSSMSTASGTYSTISEQREGSVPRSDRTPAVTADDGWPLGYVVASAFFLAIAAVGFGLWLAFDVISL